MAVRLPFRCGGIILCVLFSVPWGTQADDDLSLADSLFTTGTALLDRSGALQIESSELIARANTLRQQVKNIRPRLVDLNEGAKPVTEEILRAQIDTSNDLQRIGSRLREQSERLLDESLALFQAGLQLRWSDWVQNPGELQIDDGLASNRSGPKAHNIQVRSVHPNMTKLLPNPETKTQGGMSLEIAKLSGQRIPEALSFSTFSLSRDRQYLAHIEVESSESDNGFVVINQLQSWRLLLTSLDGDPVVGATIDYIGHMPGHVHGLPTQPQVTAELAPGVYRISGVKFQMRGWWVIDLSVSDEQSGNLVNPDNLRFNLNL